MRVKNDEPILLAIYCIYIHYIWTFWVKVTVFNDVPVQIIWLLSIHLLKPPLFLQEVIFFVFERLLVFYGPIVAQFKSASRLPLLKKPNVDEVVIELYSIIRGNGRVLNHFYSEWGKRPGNGSAFDVCAPLGAEVIRLNAPGFPLRYLRSCGR